MGLPSENTTLHRHAKNNDRVEDDEPTTGRMHIPLEPLSTILIDVLVFWMCRLIVE